MSLRLRCGVAGVLAVGCLGLRVGAQSPAGAGTASAAAPALQVAPDVKAFRAANARENSREREAALRAFVRDFPQSVRADRARVLLLTLLLEEQPRDMREIHAVAKARIDSAEKGERAARKNDVAYQLAEAEPGGVDLKSAERWTKQSIAATTLDKYTAKLKASSQKNKRAMPSADEVRRSWAESQSGTLQTLAEVYFAEGKLGKAQKAADASLRMDPTDGAASLTLGKIAHARHDETAALAELEKAGEHGGMTLGGYALMTQLYAAAHPGDAGGLEAVLDKRYRELPKAYTPTPHTGAATGRTVLLELYTGSGCQPCVAADLGLDGVLEAYPRSEVVALSFDQHIPLPDPLANADTEARGDYQSDPYTPYFLVDGKPLTRPVGGPRAEAKAAFDLVSEAVDTSLKTPSGVTLTLEATLTPEHTVGTRAAVRVNDADALKKLLETKAPEAKEMKPAEAKETSAPTAETKLVVNFALVEREVRYGGENGVRFHSMVVRSLAKPSAEGFAVAATGESNAAFTFDPAKVSLSLETYLAGFEKHNAQFGTAHFFPHETALPLEDLGVAAWVEDVTTHHVVAAAYLPVGPKAQETARR